MKRIKIAGLILFCVILIVLLPSCQNIFGSKTDTDRVYGSWLYEKDSGFRISLVLNKNGRYTYQEISSKGRILYENSGKFTLSQTRLTLKDIDESDDSRYSVYSISMRTDENNQDILDLVPTLIKKYSFKRVGESMPVETVEGEKKINTGLDGIWHSDKIGNVSISGDTVSVTLSSGEKLDATVLSASADAIELSFDDSAFDAYKSISYFVIENNLYLVFTSISTEPVVFARISSLQSAL